jgi:hypothetical protein
MESPPAAHRCPRLARLSLSASALRFPNLWATPKKAERANVPALLMSIMPCLSGSMFHRRIRRESALCRNLLDVL